VRSCSLFIVIWCATERKNAFHARDTRAPARQRSFRGGHYGRQTRIVYARVTGYGTPPPSRVNIVRTPIGFGNFVSANGRRPDFDGASVFRKPCSVAVNHHIGNYVGKKIKNAVVTPRT